MEVYSQKRESITICFGFNGIYSVRYVRVLNSYITNLEDLDLVGWLVVLGLTAL